MCLPRVSTTSAFFYRFLACVVRFRLEDGSQQETDVNFGSSAIQSYEFLRLRCEAAIPLSRSTMDRVSFFHGPARGGADWDGSAYRRREVVWIPFCVRTVHCRSHFNGMGVGREAALCGSVVCMWEWNGKLGYCHK